MPVLCERFTIQDLLGKEMGMFRWRCTDCGWTEETHDVIYGRCPACERRARQSTQEKVPETQKDVRSEQYSQQIPPIPAASHPQNAKDDAVAPLKARRKSPLTDPMEWFGLIMLLLVIFAITKCERTGPDPACLVAGANYPERTRKSRHEFPQAAVHLCPERQRASISVVGLGFQVSRACTAKPGCATHGSYAIQSCSKKGPHGDILDLVCIPSPFSAALDGPRGGRGVLRGGRHRPSVRTFISTLPSAARTPSERPGASHLALPSYRDLWLHKSSASALAAPAP